MVDCACPPTCDAEPAACSSLPERIAQAISLLSRFGSLTSSELLTLAMNLDSIANHLDALAGRKERGAAGNAYV
jgi:hypothetical protein